MRAPTGGAHRPGRRLAMLGMVGTCGLLALGIGAAIWTARVAADAPSIHDLRSTRLPQPSVVLSADGQELARFQQNRQEPLTLDQISPHVVHALIATEDRRFYTHHGVDWRSLGRAIVRTATGQTQGGSTLTQQLARNLYPVEIGRARTVERKVKEIVTALRIERLYTKEQILQAYLNTVPFLYNTVGIGAAARTYFNQQAIDLDPAQSAMLVGMLKGTYAYNPVQHPQRAQQRRNLVLGQMAAQGLLPAAELTAWQGRPIELDIQDRVDRPQLAPHFTAYVRRWLDDWARERDVNLETDGLVIHTTLHAGLQAAAAEAVETQLQALQHIAATEWAQPGAPPESPQLAGRSAAGTSRKAFAYFWRAHPELLDEALRKTPAYAALRRVGRDDADALNTLRQDEPLTARLRNDKTRLEAGFVAIEPGTGAVRAWVGSRDFAIDQFDHVAQAQRQPGSTFKPIVYAAAIERGIPVSRTYMDTPIDIQLGQGKVWRPTNMSGSTEAPMTLWEGLVYSKNTITAQVMLDAGLDRIAALARDLGIDRSPLAVVPSMALGTSPVTLLEMANVYATLANEGRHRPAYVVDRIVDKQGHLLASFGPLPERRVLSVETDHQVIDMLRGVVNQGTGHMLRSRYAGDADLAGKTGTTQRNMDAWFIAMHPQLVAGTWIGFNDQRVTVRSRYWGQGGHSAVRVVGDFMRRVLDQGLLSRKLAFAAPVRPPPAGDVDWAQAMNEDEALAPGAGPDAATDAAQDGIVPVVSAHPDDVDAPPKTAEELGEVLRAMGRDPETGAPAQVPPP
ncbi:MAG: transglycosylase domain-containing protein [Aquabacterium sp.]